MTIETKQIVSQNRLIADTATYAFVVSGFTSQPTAVLDVTVTYGNISGESDELISLGGCTYAIASPKGVTITSIVFGATSVTVTIENNAGFGKYVQDVLVTAIL